MKHEVANPVLLFSDTAPHLSSYYNDISLFTVLCPSVMKSLRISLLNPETTSFYRNVILDIMEKRKKKKKVRRLSFRLQL